MGLVVYLKLPFNIAVIAIVLCCILHYVSIAMYKVLMKRYLGNSTNKEILPKIYSANSIGRNIIRTVVGVVGSVLIGLTNSAVQALV